MLIKRSLYCPYFVDIVDKTVEYIKLKTSTLLITVIWCKLARATKAGWWIYDPAPALFLNLELVNCPSYSFSL